MLTKLRRFNIDHQRISYFIESVERTLRYLLSLFNDRIVQIIGEL